jgi:hypothetical protein
MRSDHGYVGIVRTVARLAASQMRAKNLRLLAHGRREARSGLGDRGGCVAVDDQNVIGSFGVFRLRLQFPLSLMTEFLISAFRFSGFLPKVIGAPNNFDYSRPFHSDFLFIFSRRVRRPVVRELQIPRSARRGADDAGEETLLMPRNAGIAVLFNAISTSPSLRHYPNIRHRPNIGSAQSASNGSCIL